MNVLEYNDSNYRNKQEQKEKEEFAIEFVEWLLNEWVNDERWSIITNIKELLEIYKETL